MGRRYSHSLPDEKGNQYRHHFFHWGRIMPTTLISPNDVAVVTDPAASDCTPTPVLVIPQPKSSRATESGQGAPTRSMRTVAITDRTQWSNRLAEFSVCNSGRLVALEIDDTQLGAIAQVTKSPFLGAYYDRTDDRVVIMLGNPAAGSSPLTHSVGVPRSLGILEDGHGRARALRVGYESGQALLAFLA